MTYLDIETRSQCNITYRGGYNYALHPSTEIICVSHAFKDSQISTSFIEDGPLSQELINYLNYGSVDDKIVAHNATFERLFFENQGHKYGVRQDIDLRRWVCSMATAMAAGFPPKLEDLALAMGLPIVKNTEGRRLIQTYCVPCHFIEWESGDKDLMRTYCESDVEVMRMAMRYIPHLSAEHLRQYHIIEEMNDLGVPVDLAFAEAALNYSAEIREDVNQEIMRITKGAVKKHSERKARDIWLREQLSEAHLQTLLITVNDIEKIKFDKARREELLVIPDLPEAVRKFTEQVESAGGATISKYQSMVNTHVNGRVHGSMVWSGALETGRYTSRGLQLQNMKRDVIADSDSLIADVIAGYEIDKPAHTLARLVRSSITSKRGLTWSDFSQIEARVLPWLSDEPSAQPILETFSRGEDIYAAEAKKWFYTSEVSNDMRQAAKIGVLACGFGGGANAVLSMARNYGMNMSYEEADNIKTQWREANPWAKKFWYGLQRAAESAVINPGEVYSQGKISFCKVGLYLYMRLPSGRCLAYYQPRFEETQSPWEDAPSMKLTVLWGSGKRKSGQPWPRRALYGGLLSQNATQATAADLTREVSTRAYDAGLDVLFLVHDEVVAEGFCKEELHELMLYIPVWAKGLPIDADTKEGYRYGK